MILNGYYNLVIVLQKEGINIVTAELERIQYEYNKIKEDKEELNEKISVSKSENIQKFKN